MLFIPPGFDALLACRCSVLCPKVYPHLSRLSEPYPYLHPPPLPTQAPIAMSSEAAKPINPELDLISQFPELIATYGNIVSESVLHGIHLIRLPSTQFRGTLAAPL